MIKGVTLVSVFLITSTLIGCANGHTDYIDFENSMIGKEMPYTKPFVFENAGKLVRADFVIGGQGLTHITKGTDGNLIYHISDQEVLPNVQKKEWVGKCLIYYVVDAETNIIKSWGFDEGGNPLSCRTWP
ncbi:hypothetical protein [Pseudoalteromonas sp. T1lg88]|uniref:hypothetical protein n=1 Tax=Pseudoalteromonas sp. T1lg88 TaxID=2077104 RepID=UPI000CF630FF|nr:hypothetical protein [Pseudoalteromonas sp. T1lg88]